MNRGGHLNSLTGIRGLCALWVLAYHINIALTMSRFPTDEHFPAFLINVFESGPLGVDFFFLLSGFIMCFVYRQFSDRKAVARYYLLRLARIYPVHLFMLLAYLGVKLAGFSFQAEGCGPESGTPAMACDRFAASSFLYKALLVDAWGWKPRLSWNPVSWSISSEWFMYCLFPFLLPLVRRLGSPRAHAVAIGIAFTALIGILAASSQFNAVGVSNEAGLVRVITGFLMGCFLYRLYEARDKVSLRWEVIGPLAVGALLLGLQTEWRMAAAVPLFGVIILSLAQGRGWLCRGLGTRPMVWLGQISYSLYMCHLFIIECLGIVFDDPNAAPLGSLTEVMGMISGICITSLVMAAGLYHLVEEPARRRLRRVIDRRLASAEGSRRDPSRGSADAA